MTDMTTMGCISHGSIIMCIFTELKKIDILKNIFYILQMKTFSSIVWEDFGYVGK